MGKTAQTNVVIANNNRAIIQMVPVYPDVPLVVIKEKRAKKRHGYILIKKNIKMVLIII